MANVSASTRNGLITAIGIILGFTLSFFAHWGTLGAQAGPNSPMASQDIWKPGDIPAIVTLLGGIICLLWSLGRALQRSLSEAKYDKTVTLFITGIGIAVLGFIFAIFSDLMFGWLNKHFST
jgi:hypothetical protein